MPEGPLELLLPALVRLGLVDLYNEAKAGRGTLVAQLEQLAVRELELPAVVAAEEEVVTSEKVKTGPEVLDKKVSKLGSRRRGANWAWPAGYRPWLHYLEARSAAAAASS